jgi:hypothetical protein
VSFDTQYVSIVKHYFDPYLVNEPKGQVLRAGGQWIGNYFLLLSQLLQGIHEYNFLLDFHLKRKKGQNQPTLESTPFPLSLTTG